MNDSLQIAHTLTLKNELQENTISILQLLTKVGIASSCIMIILLLLFIYSLYIFFEKYLIFNKIIKKNTSLLSDVGDLIHDAKIESALSLCKKSDSPEGRVLYKGLSRLGKPAREIHDSMNNAAQLEICELERKTGVLGIISGVAPMLGFLGSIIGISLAFSASGFSSMSSAQLLSEGIFTAMVNTALGIFTGLFAYLFYNILVLKTKKVSYSLQLTISDYLDLLNKPIL